MLITIASISFSRGATFKKAKDFSESDKVFPKLAKGGKRSF